MPKIIDNLEEKLIAETRRQLESTGYGQLTVRSVAKGCGVGVGTVYNYFSSKDELVAAYLLSDWQKSVAAIEATGSTAEGPRAILEVMHSELCSYAHRHEALFRDPIAVSATAASSGHYHALLRSQLAAPLKRFCNNDFEAEFIAESLLCWSMAEKTFPQIWSVLQRLF